MEFTLKFEGAPEVRIEVDTSRQGPAFFVLGVRKSGSSMFNRICKLLAKYNAYNFVEIAGTMFASNIDVATWANDPQIPALLRGGNVYGGFRAYPAGLEPHPVFQQARKVLLVRDPRDALVSEYFSNAYSHSLPQAAAGGAREKMLAQREKALATDVGSYVRQRVRPMVATLAEYQKLVADPQTRVFKYEDVIFRKESLIRGVVEHFGWKVTPKQVEAILGWVDVKPEQESPTQFIRKVTPGDYLEKLDADTIRFLGNELGDVMRAFAYA